jgi:hypothetical protein
MLGRVFLRVPPQRFLSRPGRTYVEINSAWRGISANSARRLWRPDVDHIVETTGFFV